MTETAPVYEIKTYTSGNDMLQRRIPEDGDVLPEGVKEYTTTLTLHDQHGRVINSVVIECDAESPSLAFAQLPAAKTAIINEMKRPKLALADPLILNGHNRFNGVKP